MPAPEIETLGQCFLHKGINALENQLDQLDLMGLQRLETLDAVRKLSANVVDEVHEPLDRMLEINEACILEALNVADGDEKFIHFANVTSYNLAANLADCWFDDDRPRLPKHFEAGVTAAKRCLQLRVLLNKPPAAMAMAYFILGVHEYSQHHFQKAETAWLSKLEQEMLIHQSAEQREQDLNVILSQGLIGLARWTLNDTDSNAFKESIDRLDAQRNADNCGEVNLFISELEILREKHGPKAS